VKRVLVICPTQRDRLNLADERILDRFDLAFVGDPVRPGMDPTALIEQLTALRPDVGGVFGSNDVSAHIARVVSDRLGLPGPSPAAFLRCHDKLACRRVQAEAVPEATPAFAELDLDAAEPAAPPLAYPFFVKPVAAHLSQLAFRIDDDRALLRALRRARREIDAITAFDRALVGRPFRSMIAEELLVGALVTFEGFMSGGEMTAIGVTDSVLHRNGISFKRFDYPSALPAAATRTMAAVAAELMPALGFDGSLFNIEFFVQPNGGVRIVEVNGRMASQFAPLVAAVHGVSSYELQLELVSGGWPQLPPARPDMVASSFVLRTYRDGVVRTVPDPERILHQYGHAHVELCVRPGERLSDLTENDPVSRRLAVVALAAPDRAALAQRWRDVRRMLRFEIEPLRSPVA
jgi:biotin carboxylase